MVERFSPTLKMYDSPRGDFVRYSDYERLRSELAACREALEKIAAWCLVSENNATLAAILVEARAALSPSIQEEGE